MKSASYISHLVTIFLFVAISLLGCSASKFPTAHSNAINDARVIVSGEITGNLISIVDANAKLVWEQFPRFNVVTMTGWSGYKNLKSNRVRLSFAVWETSLLNMQNFFQSLELDGDSLTLHIQQKPGMPPDMGEKRSLRNGWSNPLWSLRPCSDQRQVLRLMTPQQMSISRTMSAKITGNGLKNRILNSIGRTVTPGPNLAIPTIGTILKMELV